MASDPYTSEQLIKLLRDNLAAKAFAQAGNFERLNLTATAELYRTDARMLEAAATRLAQPNDGELYHELLRALGWQHVAGPTGVFRRAHELATRLAQVEGIQVNIAAALEADMQDQPLRLWDGIRHAIELVLSSTRIAPQQENRK